MLARSSDRRNYTDAAIDRDSVLEIGRSVVSAEANALLLLAERLDHGFADAVALLDATRGRIVVSGIGKSGHVARKLAATFAATGSPAQFLHGAEAGHGDLGMLAAGDTLVVLSSSGYSVELLPLIEHAMSLHVGIVAIGSHAQAPLMRDATVALLLPIVAEACGSNIAPTTSSTMMIALGDALAIALMKRRGIGRDRLQVLHPGGQIGRRLLPVSRIMHAGPEMPLVTPETSMPDVILTITAHRFGVAGVVAQDGSLIGVITDGDLRRHMDGLMHACAADVMTAAPITVSGDALVDDAHALMAERKVMAVFVVEGDRPAGLIHVHDILSRNIG